MNPETLDGYLLFVVCWCVMWVGMCVVACALHVLSGTSRQP